MTIPIGCSEYSADSTRVKARAVSYSPDDLSASIAILAQKLWDQQSLDELEFLAQSIDSTGFDATEIRVAFDAVPNPTSWRAGEELAELCSSAHLGVSLPWPINWDLKNESRSLSGADLVGFQVSGNSAVFAFGEVKTSSDHRSPPAVLSGRVGAVRNDNGHTCRQGANRPHPVG